MLLKLITKIPVKVEQPKWILYRHINDFDLLCSVAIFLKSFSKTNISKEDKVKLNQKLKGIGLYSERNPNMPLDAMSHKINQLSYFMFGYQAKVNGEARFLYSPLGNLFLKHHENKETSPKIFLAMLWAIQFQHPHSGTSNDFQLYPFRLVFKLLSDKRLATKLFAYEVAYLIVFIQKTSTPIYEDLVAKLLILRNLSDEELARLFQADSHAYVNSAYEWDYYVSNLISGAGVLVKQEGKVICKLQHGTTNTFRKITRNEVSIVSDLIGLVQKLETQYSFLEQPLLLNDTERLKIDVIKEIYSFYPRVLLEEIGELEDDLKIELLNLPKLIERYSNNTDGVEAYLFEDALVEGFNLFYNVEAEKVGGLGSGTIAIACYNAKLDLTACEISENYFQKALEKIKTYVPEDAILNNTKSDITIVRVKR